MGKVQQHKRAAKEKKQVDSTKNKAKEKDRFIVYGEVDKCLPNTMFRVTVTDSEVPEMVGKELLCTLSGKMRLYRIRVMPGDLIKGYVSKYDLSRCIITYRSTKKDIRKDYS